MMIFTSWMNLATMSFPFQPLIQYRAVVRARRPLKSSTCPASEGSRRYVNIYQEQSSPIPSLCRNKRFALNEMFQRNSCLLYVSENQSTSFFCLFFIFWNYIFPYEWPRSMLSWSISLEHFIEHNHPFPEELVTNFNSVKNL